MCIVMFGSCRRLIKQNALRLEIRSGLLQLSLVPTAVKGHGATYKDSFVIARETKTKLRKRAICFHLLGIQSPADLVK